MITLVDRLEQLPQTSETWAVTIGTFDGVHLGHQAILQQLSLEGLPCAALTFSHHPSAILRPSQSTPLLVLPAFRYRLLEKAGVHNVVAIPFSKEIEALSAHMFLEKLQSVLPFERLVLGHDATLGKSREGDRHQIEQLADQMGFKVIYVPPLRVDNVQVSSSLIRNAVRQGRLKDASRWLGRLYSLAGYIVPGLGQGRKIGFPTLNIDVSTLCLPPFGVYAVELLGREGVYPGVANLGLAPTVRTAHSPMLEVHLLNDPGFTIDGLVEVVMHTFFRPEKKFASLDELRVQIALDIASVKETLNLSN